MLSGLKDFLKALAVVNDSLTDIHRLVKADRKSFIDDIYPPLAPTSNFFSIDGAEVCYDSSSLWLDWM